MQSWGGNRHGGARQALLIRVYLDAVEDLNEGDNVVLHVGFICAVK